MQDHPRDVAIGEVGRDERAGTGRIVGMARDADDLMTRRQPVGERAAMPLLAQVIRKLRR